jgi:transposase
VSDFKQNYPDGLIIALDQMTVYLQENLARVWSVRGQSPVFRQAAQRESLKFYGALELQSGYEMALALPKMDSENTIHFLQHLLACLPQRQILLLWDRASWHKGAARRFVEAHERLDYCYLPTACPDFNPQEHVWKAARSAAGRLFDYSHLSALRQAFQAYLENNFFKLHWLEKYLPNPLFTSAFS